MSFTAYLVAGLTLVAAPAKADDTPKSGTAAQSDVTRGVDADTPKAPDHHAKIERHWEPGHVEAKERSTARHDTTASKKKGRNETTDVHRKVEKRSDGSVRTEVEKTHVYDRGAGETTDHTKTVTDSRPTDEGGRTITRDVTREHDAPGSANDHKTHVKEKIEKDASGNVVNRERSE